MDGFFFFGSCATSLRSLVRKYSIASAEPRTPDIMKSASGPMRLALLVVSKSSSSALDVVGGDVVTEDISTIMIEPKTAARGYFMLKDESTGVADATASWWKASLSEAESAQRSHA